MRITVLGDPFPKARARIFTRHGKVRSYDPQFQQKQKLKKALHSLFHQAYENLDDLQMLEAAELHIANNFTLNVHFYLPFHKEPRRQNLEAWGLEPANSKPDLSNLLKTLEDCANNILYKDDCMITSCTMHKSYSLNPRTEIEIMPKKKLDISNPVLKTMELFNIQSLMELVNDAKLLGEMLLEYNKNGLEHPNEIWVNTTASILNRIALRHADSLSKAKKIGKISINDC